MNWYRRCSYDTEQKRRFHSDARKRLKCLAVELGFRPASYEIRSNLGGIAVSGEVILHHEAVYIQICQPATGHDTGVMIRTCQGRRDYSGGRNHFEPLARLDDIDGLAARVREIMTIAGASSACRRST